MSLYLHLLQSDDSMGNRKPRGARRASSLFSDRPKSMRALAAAAAADGADSGSEAGDPRPASRATAAQQKLQRVVQQQVGREVVASEASAVRQQLWFSAMLCEPGQGAGIWL